MRRALLSTAVLVSVLPGSAGAQTSGLNPLTIIAEYESSYGTNLQNPTSSASGIYQDINSTWAQALSLCGCGTTSEYPTASSAPASVQTAANAALYNAQGFAPWTIGDQPLANAIAADGGASAFATNLSTDPVSYASLDTSAGLAAYFADDSSLSVACTNCDGTGTGTLASAAAAAGVTGTATASVSDASSPFSFLFNEYTNKISSPLQNQLATVQGMAVGPLTALIAISWMVLGVGVWGGRVDFGVMVNRTIRMALVVALSGAASTWYQNVIVATFDYLPTWISQQILGSTGGNPASGLDAAMHSFNADIPQINWNLPWGVPSAVGEIGLIAIAAGFMYGSLVIAFIVFMVTQILAGILLVIGPIVLPFALFDRTLGWVDRWLSSLMGKMLTFLCTAIVVSLMLGVIQDAFQSLPSPSQATAGVYQLLGVGVIAVVLAAAMGSLPFVIGHIAAASGLPRMDYASRALGMAGSAATGAAGRGVRGILGS
jgi:hypothetical protein